MFDRSVEDDDLLGLLDAEGVGCIAFSPLAQGLLTSKYVDGIPAGSRAATAGTALGRDALTEDKINRARQLSEIAASRGQTLAQMALAWVLRKPEMTSAILGASSVAQIEENVRALDQLEFTAEELDRIDELAH